MNDQIKYEVDIPALGYFLRCYFNDYLGGISFAAYVNFILSFSIWTEFRCTKFHHFLIEGLLLSAVWEGIVPFFLAESTRDIYDVAAYLAGIFTYYFITVLTQKQKNCFISFKIRP